MTRTAILSAITVMAVVMLPLTGCAKKESKAPAKNKATSPTGSKATKTQGKTPASGSPTTAKPAPAVPAPTGKPEASAPAVTEAPAKPVYLGQVLYAWNTGKKGDAVNQFLQLNWQDPAVFQGIPVLSMTEQQFTALPQEQRDRLSQQVQQLSQSFRGMADAVVASTDSFIASNNPAGARARLEALQQFGQALAAPEHLEIIQLVGKSITGLAQDKLSTVK